MKKYLYEISLFNDKYLTDLQDFDLIDEHIVFKLIATSVDDIRVNDYYNLLNESKCKILEFESDEAAILWFKLQEE